LFFCTAKFDRALEENVGEDEAKVIEASLAKVYRPKPLAPAPPFIPWTESQSLKSSSRTEWRWDREVSFEDEVRDMDILFV
jgi:hypothetical protein